MRAGNLQDTAMQVSLSIYLPIRYANVGYLTSPLLESESTGFGSTATFQFWSSILPKAVEHLAEYLQDLAPLACFDSVK